MNLNIIDLISTSTNLAQRCKMIAMVHNEFDYFDKAFYVIIRSKE